MAKANTKKIEQPKAESKGAPKSEFSPEFESPDEKGAEQIFACEGMIPTKSDGIQIQPRTRELPVPKMFFFEPEKPKRKDASTGNDHNQISQGVHQVDPHRSVSFNPIMPNLAMLKETGNPFPADSTHETVKTSSAYEPYVKFAHLLWNELSAKTEPVKAKDLCADIAKKAKVGLDSEGNPTSTCRRAMTDILRDLRLYGLAVTADAKHNFRSTEWALAKDAGKIEFTAPKKS